jgi:Bacterial SH3 domain
MATAPVGKSPLRKNRMLKPPAIELTLQEAETERPSIVRLTAIIAVCFSAGVAWPLFGGLNFVQRPPGNNAMKPLEGGAPGEADPNGPSTLATEEVPVAHVAPLLTTRQAVSIESHQVLSCQGDAGGAVARCDEPNLERVLEGPIAKLADCGAADGASGVLSLGLHLDFFRGSVTRVKLGQSTTLSKRTAARLIACAGSTVVGTALDDVEHEHARYWVYYLVRFLPPGSPIDPAAAPASEELVGASGQATIGWTTAVVRERASPRAKIATRLSYGTRVNVTGRMGDWYRIEHGGKVLGWVQRKAIGM